MQYHRFSLSLSLSLPSLFLFYSSTSISLPLFLCPLYSNVTKFRLRIYRTMRYNRPSELFAPLAYQSLCLRIYIPGGIKPIRIHGPLGQKERKGEGCEFIKFCWIMRRTTIRGHISPRVSSGLVSGRFDLEQAFLKRTKIICIDYC